MWPRIDGCRWQPSSTAPALSKLTSATAAGLPSTLPLSISSAPSPGPALNCASPAAEARTWWSHVSLLTKRTLVPTATTLVAGTKRIFSCRMVMLRGRGVFGRPLPEGCTMTTASGTGAPSLSRAVTVRLPACAAAQASRAARAVASGIVDESLRMASRRRGQSGMTCQTLR